VTFVVLREGRGQGPINLFIFSKFTINTTRQRHYVSTEVRTSDLSGTNPLVAIMIMKVLLDNSVAINIRD
jgi:hypothetical protein